MKTTPLPTQWKSGSYIEKINPFRALPRKDYFSVAMWFALDVEPKYFAKSDGLPPFVLLVSQNDCVKPLRAMNGTREIFWRKKPSHFLMLSPEPILERKLRVQGVSVTEDFLHASEEWLSERLHATESTHYANRQITVFVLK